jgi:hypothetical protein
VDSSSQGAGFVEQSLMSTLSTLDSLVSATMPRPVPLRRAKRSGVWILGAALRLRRRTASQIPPDPVSHSLQNGG